MSSAPQETRFFQGVIMGFGPSAKGDVAFVRSTSEAFDGYGAYLIPEDHGLEMNQPVTVSPSPDGNGAILQPRIIVFDSHNL